jgi:hypothetical protein
MSYITMMALIIVEAFNVVEYILAHKAIQSSDHLARS